MKRMRGKLILSGELLLFFIFRERNLKGVTKKWARKTKRKKTTFLRLIT